MRKARVLVADDEPNTTELVGLMLGFCGYEVCRAFDGAQALDLARSERPDLVLLDVMMPRMDGCEVSRALKKDPELADIPVILFSSADEREIRWRAAGADAFLQKPFDLLRLPDLLERFHRTS
jgi:CheY-like chemotaxis protein